MTGKNEIMIFHESVTGYSHIRKGIGCQDASDQYCSQDGKFRIVAVADGHGDQACVRSDRGSAFAVSAAMECMQAFGEYYQEYQDIEEQNAGRAKADAAVRQLTNAILSQWSQMVSADIASDPLSGDDYEAARAFADQYSQRESAEKVYGTTLAAALAAEDYLLLIQQGDGVCDIIYADGVMNTPLPEDDRCHGHVTSSLSDEDAPERIRGRIVPNQPGEIIGCFVGTDGLFNRFHSDSERHELYMRSCLEISEQKSEKGLSELLTSILKDVSLNGNGDDVSWAGIFDSESIKLHAKSLLDRLEEQRETEKNKWYREQVAVLEEKMEQLKHQIDASEAEEQVAYYEEYLKTKARYQEMKAKVQ